MAQMTTHTIRNTEDDNNDNNNNNNKNTHCRWYNRVPFSLGVSGLKFVPIVLYIMLLYPPDLCAPAGDAQTWDFTSMISDKINHVMGCGKSRAGLFIICVAAYLFLAALTQVRLGQELQTDKAHRPRLLRYWFQVLFLFTSVAATQVFIILFHTSSQLHYVFAFVCLLAVLMVFLLVLYNMYYHTPHDKFIYADRQRTDPQSVPLSLLLVLSVLFMFFTGMIAVVLFGLHFRACLSLIEYVVAGLYILTIIML